MEPSDGEGGLGPGGDDFSAEFPTCADADTRFSQLVSSVESNGVDLELLSIFREAAQPFDSDTHIRFGPALRHGDAFQQPQRLLSQQAIAPLDPLSMLPMYQSPSQLAFSASSSSSSSSSSFPTGLHASSLLGGPTADTLMTSAGDGYLLGEEIGVKAEDGASDPVPSLEAPVGPIIGTILRPSSRVQLPTRSGKSAGDTSDEEMTSLSDHDEDDDEEEELSMGGGNVGASASNTTASGSGVPRPGRRVRGNKASDETDQRKRRLARKAELARQSRRRKKMYVQDLEAKVKKLGAKLEELQRKHAQAKANRRALNLSSEERNRREGQIRIRRLMAEIVMRQQDSTEPVDQTTQENLQMFINQFIENSRERQARVEFYLDRVEDCLAPGLQVKFALWGLDQNDDFYTRPGLWHNLMVDQVGLSHEQMRALVERRQAIHQERQNLAECEWTLRALRQRIRAHLQSMNGQMDYLRRVFTPMQLAKFFVWVEQNEWCVQMFDSAWSHNEDSAAGAARSGADASAR